MTCYYMGRLGNVVWIVKKEKVDKMQTFLQGKGGIDDKMPSWAEVIAIALGFMRSKCMADFVHVCRKADTVCRDAAGIAGSNIYVLSYETNYRTYGRWKAQRCLCLELDEHYHSVKGARVQSRSISLSTWG